MVKPRWTLLWLAIACGIAAIAAPALGIVPQHASDIVRNVLWLAAALLQALGVLGMRGHMRANAIAAPTALIVGFGAAGAWALALLFGFWTSASGPAGIVPGLLLMLPAVLLGLLLQAAGLFLFANADNKRN